MIMRHRYSNWSFRSAIACALVVACAAAAVAGQADEAQREKTERVADTLAALGSQEGRKIADVGAADGFYALRIARAVAPTGGGTLIVIEAIHDNIRTQSREQQVKEHEIGPEFVEAELRAAGFEILERQDPFTTFTRPPPGGFWMIRARRP